MKPETTSHFAPPSLSDPSARLIHNDTVVQEMPDGFVGITTPAAIWAYALEFRLEEAAEDVAVTMVIELVVTEGKVGVGCVSAGGQYLCEAFLSADDKRTAVALPVPALHAAKALIVRNASDSGPSTAVLRAISIQEGMELEPEPEPETPDADEVPRVAWSGVTPPHFAAEATVMPDATAELVGDGSLLVETPTSAWAYAVELPLAQRNDDAGATVSIDMTVTAGEAGIAFVAHDATLLSEVFRSVEDGRTIAMVQLRSLSTCKSIVVRNGSRVGASSVLLHAVAFGEPASGDLPLLVVPAETFTRYQRWSGLVPGGYVIDWLGTRTRGDVENYLLSDAIAPRIANDREMTPPIPASELLLDWVPLLEAVELSGGKFTAVALGAGWGRWIVASAYAATQRNRDYYIVGVEAEPQHFAWMQRHLEDNKIDPAKARLIHAAANAYTGVCMFQVGDPTGNYGQSVISETQLRSPEFLEILAQSGLTPTETPCVDLVEVLQGIDRVDYMHMDIQGSEADFLLAHPEELEARVAVVNIGTHSELIERRLRRHFTTAGWLRRYDIPMNSKIMARRGSEEPAAISFGDGVQVWENPRLTGRTEAPSFVVPDIITG